jgi:chromosome segregation ATPase
VDSEEQKILKENRLKKRIHWLFNFVFAGFLFFGKLTVSIGSKLWLLKAKFLLAALAALLSLTSYRFGSDNSKRTTILKPSHELIQLNKTLEMLPELHRSFISDNQKQLYQLTQNLEALQRESRAKRESMFQLRKDFIKATRTLEINYEVILAEKKETSNLKTLLSQKITEVEKLQTKLNDVEIRNKKFELEFKKKLWKRGSKISNLEKVITDYQSQIKNLQAKLEKKDCEIGELKLTITQQTYKISENQILLEQFTQKTEQNQIIIEALKKDLELKMEECSKFTEQLNYIQNQMSQLHEKWDDREKRNNIERIFSTAERLFGSGLLKIKH